MLMCSLTTVLLLLGISPGKLLNMELDEINSHIHFAGKVQKCLLEKEDEISTLCRTHLSEYVQGLLSKQNWALKMFDAGAKLPSGMLNGNIVELGSFDECLDIKKDISTTEMVMGKYCLGEIQHQYNISLNSSKHVPEPKNVEIISEFFQSEMGKNIETNIQLATCLPHSCSAAEIQELYSCFNLGMEFSEKSCQTKATQPELDTGGIIALSFFGIIFSMMIASTVYDILLFYLQKSPLHPLLIAFSVLTNGKKLIATSNSPSQISCLHGIRVITTMWVILFHRYKIQFKFPLKNYSYMVEWIKNDLNMIIISAPLSVDTFFLIGGLVISCTFMNSVSKGAKFNVIMYYIHRYLRLTPLFAAMILIHVTLLRHLGSGPLWPSSIQSYLIDGCEKNWWKALLYIQNYGKREGGTCVPQSWYLCVDTQLFLLSPVLLIPLKKWPKLTLSATGFLAVCSIITCFLTGWFFELNTSIMGNPNVGTYMKYYYLPTQTRAAPWFIGIILGYFIFEVKQKKRKININKLVVISLWIASLTVLCTCVFAGNNLAFGKYRNDKLRNSLHMTLVRPSWIVALGWVIFACVSGFGGPVNWFLSLPIFQVISKITYSLYLVHYTLIFIAIAQMRTTPIVTNAKEMYIFWGDLAFTSVFAVILTLAFETPIITIEKCIFGSTNKKEGKSPNKLKNSGKSITTT